MPRPLQSITKCCREWVRYACLDSHRHGPLFLDKFRSNESLQLHPAYDKGEQRRCGELNYWQERKTRRLRWVMDPIVGAGAAFVAISLDLITDFFWDLRMEAVNSLLVKGNASPGSVFLALIACAAIALGLTMAAAVGVAWQPQAASSGIPGVVAFLNGCDWRNALTGRVLLVRLVGTAFACAAGLMCGPEGPMIHMGTIVGMQSVNRILRPALRRFDSISGKKFDKELAREPLRYHFQAAAMGAGAGIAAAFQAPLAGTVFVCEEAASYFSKRLFYHSMITCAFAALVTMSLSWLFQLHEISMYSKLVSCNVETSWSALLMLQAIQVGIFCGILAARFNRIVVTMNAMRATTARHLGNTRRLVTRRLCEVAAITLATSCFLILAPMLMPCRDASLQMLFTESSGCFPEEWHAQLVSYAQIAAKKEVWSPKNAQKARNENFQVAWTPTPGLFGIQYNPLLCPKAVAEVPSCHLAVVMQGIPHAEIGPETLTDPNFCCGFRTIEELRAGQVFSASKPAAPLELLASAWPSQVCLNNPTRMDEYNPLPIPQYSPLAALLLAKPRAIVKNLMSRGGNWILPIPDLMVFLAGYYTLAAVTSGAWVPAGLVLPHMVIGATIGRLSGLMWVSLLKSSATSGPTLTWVKVIQPVIQALRPVKIDVEQDAGVLAMVGAAAFLSGSGALVLFVVVLILELTWDPYIIPVVVLAMVTARITAGLFGSHGLYHELIEVQCFPLLPEHEHWKHRSWQVRDILEADEARAQQFERGASGWRSVTEEALTVAGTSFSSSRAWQSQVQAQETPSSSQPPIVGREPSTELTPPAAQAPAAGIASAGHADPIAELVGAEIPGPSWHTGTLVYLKRVSTMTEIQTILDTRLPGDEKPMINGFPVVEDESGQLCGLVTRSALKGFHQYHLRLAGIEVLDRQGSITGPEYDALGRSLVQNPATDSMVMASFSRRRPSVESNQSASAQERLDLGDIMDMAPWVLEENAPVHQAHVLFRAVGVRHVVVVDKAYRPVGILTRKSLMPARLPGEESPMVRRRVAAESGQSDGQQPRGLPAGRSWSVSDFPETSEREEPDWT